MARPHRRPARHDSPALFRSSRQRLSRILRCEPLEDRRLLAAITVDLEDDLIDFNDGKTSLREAIFAANTVPGADEIRFDFGHDGPVTLLLTQGELKITDSLSILGPGASLLTIDASGSDLTPLVPDGSGVRHFRVDDGIAGATIDVSISGMSLIRGDGVGNGGAVFSTESLTVDSVQFISNYAWGDGAQASGGGLYSSGNLAMRSSLFQDNHAGSGGGLVVETAGVGDEAKHSYVVDTSFVANSNIGVRIVTAGESTAVLDRMFSSNNRSPDRGGNVFSSSGTSNIEVRNSEFTQNSSSRGSGAVVGAYDSATVSFYRTKLNSNFTALRGGGMSASVGMSGAVIIEECDISNNRSGIQGGGLYVSFWGSSGRQKFALINSTISGNFAERGGGGVYLGNLSGDVVIEGTRFVSNSSRYHGGGLYAESPSDDAILNVLNSEFQGNVAVNHGGGVYADMRTTSGRAKAIFDGNEFQRNRADGDGAGLWLDVGSTGGGGEALVRNSLFDRNIAKGDGGGISVRSATTVGKVKLDLSHLTFLDNQGRRGGGLNVQNTTNGGAATATLEFAAFKGNSAAQSGGGLFVTASGNSGLGKFAAWNLLVAGNSAETGGGVAVDASRNDAFRLENATISGNSARSHGGGVWAPGLATLRHSTVADNRADSDGNDSGSGGGLSGKFALDHVIAANNVRGAGSSTEIDDDVSGTMNGRYSIVEKIVGSSATIAGDIGLVGIDPQLGPLSDNGSATLPGNARLLTYSLQPMSPAIDAGDAAYWPGIDAVPEFDQRGAPFSRLVGQRIDIGAFERQNGAGVLDADFNFDGVVDGGDFLAWQRGYGKTPATFRQGDATADGDVDANDLSVWRVRFGGGNSSAEGIAKAAALSSDALAVDQPAAMNFDSGEAETASPRVVRRTVALLVEEFSTKRIAAADAGIRALLRDRADAGASRTVLGAMNVPLSQRRFLENPNRQEAALDAVDCLFENDDWLELRSIDAM